MNSVIATGRIFNSKVVLIIASENEIVEMSLRPFRLKTWIDRLVRTPLEGEGSAIHCGAFLGVNIDNAASPKAELGGKRTGDQAYAAD